jgi:hypothetical protein
MFGGGEIGDGNPRSAGLNTEEGGAALNEVGPGVRWQGSMN